MKLSVKVLQGKELNFEVEPDQTIPEVKRLIQSKIGVPLSQQRLVFKGRTLSDESKLTDHKITEGQKIFLSVKKSDTNTPSPTDAGDDSAEKDCTVLWQEMTKFLSKHFKHDDCQKILKHIKEEYKHQILQLSLDDIERLAYANLEAKRESG